MARGLGLGIKRTESTVDEMQLSLNPNADWQHCIIEIKVSIHVGSNSRLQECAWE